MFCKYCGRNIPETSEFCPECGKKLKKESVKIEEERTPAGTVFALMLLALCGSTVVNWGRVLLEYQFHIGMLITAVMLVAGLALLGRLIGQEKICTADYRLSDLLVFLLWIVLPGLLFRWESQVYHPPMGRSACNAYQAAKHVIMPTIQLPAFWLMMGLIVLGLGRRGNWQPAQKRKWMLLVVLALCSVLGFLFAPQLAMLNDAPIEVTAIAAQTTRLWCVLCWLWPLVVLQVFRRLGSGEIGSVGAGAALVGIQLGKIFLLPMILFQFNVGPVGFGLAEGLSPLFGLLILCIATRLHKKKQG